MLCYIILFYFVLFHFMFCYINLFLFMLFYFIMLLYVMLYYLYYIMLFSKSPKIKQDICTYTHEARTVLCHAHTITSAKMTFPTTCKTQLP